PGGRRHEVGAWCRHLRPAQSCAEERPGTGLRTSRFCQWSHMTTGPATPLCDVPGCGQPAAVAMQAPVEPPGREHLLCQAHASWLATKLRKAGVAYSSRPLAAA